jgi:hypothetical protein
MLASIKKALPFRLQQAIASQNLMGKSKAKNNTTKKFIKIRKTKI